MFTMLSAAIAAFVGLTSIVTPVLAGFNPASSNNVAVYWGQNSFQQAAGPLAQQRLSEYCANSDIDIIPIAFLMGIKSPLLNFANQGNSCTPILGSSLFYCHEIEQDIQTCQNTYGKTILLSLGGDFFTENGFSSPSEAASNAEDVWSWFGPKSADSSVPRPFGNAIIDGFDFDFEHTTTNLPPFAQRLRANADAATQAGDKHYIFTAAPQCPFPDQVVGPMLGGGPWDLASIVAFDAIFVQFYNNNCGTGAFVPGSAVQTIYNFAQWDTWARTVSLNPNVKIFMGVPGNVGGASYGYAPASAVEEMIVYNKQFSSFGGVMVWEATQAYSNPGFLSSIKNALDVPTAGGLASLSALPSVAPAAHPTPAQPSAAQPTAEEAPINQSTQSEIYAGEVASVNNDAVPNTLRTVTVANNPTPKSDPAFSTPTLESEPAASHLDSEVTPTAEAESSETPPLTPISEATPPTEVVAHAVAESSEIPAPKSVSASAPFKLVSEWNQCGGIDYTGPTECEYGLVCIRGGSDWWYSCKMPGSVN